jgi:hypothetical protein
MNWEKMAFGVCDYATPQIDSASVARSRKEKLYFNSITPYTVTVGSFLGVSFSSYTPLKCLRPTSVGLFLPENKALL